jgi:hypothetical protein
MCQQQLLCLLHCQLQLLLQRREQLRALQLLLQLLQQRGSQPQHLLQLQQQCTTGKSRFRCSCRCSQVNE